MGYIKINPEPVGIKFDTENMTLSQKMFLTYDDISWQPTDATRRLIRSEKVKYILRIISSEG